jgi:hypothetical protein
VSEIVGIEVTVKNRSRIAAGPFDVQLFDGDPEAGGVAIGASVLMSGLGGGAIAVASFSWDTAGFQGPHTLVAVADFSGALSEVSKEDNAAALDVDVLPPLPNLVSQLSALPARPIAGSPTMFTARVENRGSLASFPTLIRFFRETPRLGIVLGEAEVPALASGAFSEVSETWDSAGPVGTHRIYAVVDPESEVRERLETDNETSLSLDVRPPPPAQPDLQIESFVLSPGELQGLPQNVVVSARIANTGLDPVPTARVELFLGNPGEGGRSRRHPNVLPPSRRRPDRRARSLEQSGLGRPAGSHGRGRYRARCRHGFPLEPEPRPGRGARRRRRRSKRGDSAVELGGGGAIL